MDTRYYYTDNETGAVKGPADTATLRLAKSQGIITETTQICPEGSNDWKPLADLAFLDALPESGQPTTEKCLFDQPGIIIILTVCCYPIGLAGFILFIIELGGKFGFGAAMSIALYTAASILTIQTATHALTWLHDIREAICNKHKSE